MEQLICRPKLYQFENAKAFAEAFSVGENDLILTNRYLYEPFFGELSLRAQLLYQEEFGMGEPTDTMVDALIRAASEKSFRRLIAIGGGTVIDIAKVLAVAGDRNVDELYEKKDSLAKTVPLILIPTTCGTGSEVTNLSIINRTRLGVKMGLASEALYADYAVLIPQLLTRLPLSVFAPSSIDALVHAVESALSPKATAYTRLLSERSMELLIGGFQGLVRDGLDRLPERVGDFLIASNMAGLAFGTAGCGAVHALSYPLGGAYHVPHGESNYALFTGVLRKYREKKDDGALHWLNEKLAGLLDCTPDTAYKSLEKLLNQILPKKALHEYGVKPEELEAFTDSVLATQGRLMANNFTPLTRDDVLDIYQNLF